MSTHHTPTPDEVMAYLKVLERFETPAYASAWRFFQQLGAQCPDYETFKTQCPLWSEPYSQFDLVMCSYETAAILLKHQALNEDLFFEQLPRVIDVWHTAEPWVRGLRHDYRAGLFASVEQMAVRMEQWEREQAERESHATVDDLPGPGKEEIFMQKARNDLAGAYTVAMCYIGDRLGLFADLARNGAASSQELAARLCLQERYVREWLSALACANYILYDASTGRFHLPAEHVPSLVEAGGPFSLGGWYPLVIAQLGVLNSVIQAFRQGGGVSYTAYSPDLWEGEARISARMYDQLLLQEWFPLLPEVAARLTEGVEVADLGCGQGKGLINLAQAFPASRYTGYDVSELVITQARQAAEAAGVAERVTFVHQPIAGALPAIYDVIMTFNVVHHAAYPVQFLRSIRQSLRPGGIYLCLDLEGVEHLDVSMGQSGVCSYGESVLFCMTTALAGGEEALGSLGLSEVKLRTFCQQAGFGAVRRVPLERPGLHLYVIRT
jgi:2-polyprenyl-3-methyl-5-hydroxy-6-metoxy-1,4-benzoquinol methylase